jgi:hypothetical protein
MYLFSREWPCAPPAHYSLNKPIICPILIGRQLELTTLRALIDQTKGGQVVLISGEAGIGKSRLVAEAKAYAEEQGFLLLLGNCFPTDRSYPYAPILDLLQSSHAKELLATYITNLELHASELRQFETPAGFIAPCEMLVAVGIK